MKNDAKESLAVVLGFYIITVIPTFVILGIMNGFVWTITMAWVSFFVPTGGFALLFTFFGLCWFKDKFYTRPIHKYEIKFSNFWWIAFANTEEIGKSCSKDNYTFTRWCEDNLKGPWDIRRDGHMRCLYNEDLMAVKIAWL